MKLFIHKWYRLVITLSLMLIVVACNSGVVAETEAAPSVEPVTPTFVPTETPVPTPEPAPPLIVLSVPSDGEVSILQAVQDYLADWTSSAGYRLEVMETVLPEAVQSDWAGVIFLQEPDNLDAILESAPDLRILVVSEMGRMGDGNLTVVQVNRIQQTFIAGYLSVLAAPDWRLGGLLPWDDAEVGAVLQEAFTNGAAYHCGRCASTYMPVTLFPVLTSLPSDSSVNDWLNAYTTLNQNHIVYVIYLAPEAASDELIQALNEQNVVMVGSKSPPSGVENRWAATVSIDVLSAINTAVTNMFSGTTGQTIVAPVTITDVNTELISDGRMRLVEDVIALLEEGALLPLSPDYP